MEPSAAILPFPSSPETLLLYAMNEDRLLELLDGIGAAKVAVLGDFFLDRYLVTEPALAEISIETGLEALQVTEIRCSPGAAGTVTNNLSALGVGFCEAIGAIGEDGEGWELRCALAATGARTDRLLSVPGRFTPTYMKPMVREAAGERELSRLDIKNRSPLPLEAENAVIQALHEIAEPGGVQAVILADQVQERNCGVLTDRVRDAVAKVARERPGVLFLADSRVRIGEFRNVIVKPNVHEAARALEQSVPEEEALPATGEPLALELSRRSGQTAFVTLGPKGILVADRGSVHHIPAPVVRGPIDIVGAGDSVTAGIVATLCAGATRTEAAFAGNLCASVTIRKLGTTGTVSRAELFEAFRNAVWPP